MNHPFIVNRFYDRKELLDFVGSKQLRSGILWGPLSPDVTICTSGGKHGNSAGYSDGENPDGTWTYFGQGQNGDQNPSKGANKRLLEGDKSVLLFSTREPTSAEARARGSYSKRYLFKGSFCVDSWDFFQPLSGSRKSDQLIQITLIPASDDDQTADSASDDASSLLPDDLLSLRRYAKSVSPVPRKGIRSSIEEYYLRSRALKKYALLRSRGVCELCNHPAPFVTPAGVAFLEVHHILRLADDGCDLPENVAAICPNCHRAAHHSLAKKSIRLELISTVAAKEKRFLDRLGSLDAGLGMRAKL